MISGIISFVLRHFSRFLEFKNKYLNVQLIQTTSILIQNIQNKTSQCKAATLSSYALLP